MGLAPIDRHVDPGNRALTAVGRWGGLGRWAWSSDPHQPDLPHQPYPPAVVLLILGDDAVEPALEVQIGPVKLGAQHLGDVVARLLLANELVHTGSQP